MPIWTPKTEWLDQDVFIIGGGNSLRLMNFDWSLLIPERTIGCNTAFLLGPEICKICFFGDHAWFVHFQEQLKVFKGSVFTNAPQFETKKPLSKVSWVNYIPRQAVGLYKDALGWNGNTGASAINLALILGAKRVFLLGYDMQVVDGKSNWHDEVIRKEAVKPSSYRDFRRHFVSAVRDWKAKFPDKEIVNLTKGDYSALEGFPKVDIDEFWKQRKAGV